MEDTHGEPPAAKEKSQSEGNENEAAEHSAITDVDLLQDLLDYTPNHVYFKDIHSHFIRISKSQAGTFGLSDPSEAIGKSDFDFFTKEHAEQAYRDEQEIMQTGETLTKEEKETWPDRPDNWVETTKMPLRDKKGKVIGTFGISKNITVQKHMEKELGEEQNLVHALMDNLPDAIYFKDAESRFIRINQALARWFGLAIPSKQSAKRTLIFSRKNYPCHCTRMNKQSCDLVSLWWARRKKKPFQIGE